MKWIIKDQLRKIKSNLFHFISLSVLIFIISFAFTAIKSSVDRLEVNYDAVLESQNAEDFYFTMGSIDMSFLGGTAQVELCQSLDILEDCAIAFAQPDNPEVQNNLNFIVNQKIQEKPEVYEALVDSVVEQFASQKDYVVEKAIVANVTDDDYVYKFLSIKEVINIPYIHEGVMPSNLNEIAIYEDFAVRNDLVIGDKLEINDIEYTISGFVYQIDFTFPLFSFSTIQFDPNVQTVVVTTKDTMRALPDNLLYRYHVQGDITELIGEIGYSSIASTDFSRFSKSMQMMEVLFPRELNFRFAALHQEIDIASTFINAFLPVFMSLTLLTILLFLNRYIDENKKDIKTLRQLGYNDTEISIGMMTIPLLISFFSIIGYLVALGFSDSIFELYASRYYFDTSIKKFSIDILLYSALVPFIILNVITFIKIRRLMKFKEKTVKSRLFKYTPLKTLLTSGILFLFVGLFIQTGLNGGDMFSEFVEHTKEGNHFEEMVNLENYTNTPVPEGYEPYIRENVIFKEINGIPLEESFRTAAYAMDADTTLKRLVNDDITNNSLLNDGIIISEFLQDLQNLEIRDTVTFTVGEVSFTKEIVGISNELIESNLFMLKSELLESFDIDNDYYNGLFAIDSNYPNDNVLTRINYDSSIDEFTEVLTISTMILNVLLVLGSIIAIYLLFLILLDFNHNYQKDIAILMGLGFTNSEIHKKYTLNLYLTLLLMSTLSIPLTIFLLRELLDLLIDTLGYKLILSISTQNIVVGVLIIHIIFGLYILWQNRFLDKINISEHLKIK